MQKDYSEEINRDRLGFILDQQAHCDRYLAPIADPKDKSVMVVGAGAGTEIVWCLERGASSVTAIDIKPQPTIALEKALGQESQAEKYRVLEMGVEDADSLQQTFDLVISNNVFEHLPDVPRALEVCRDLARPGTGRIAIFSSPLFFSSSGSHLAHQPWEHLWGDPEALRQKLLASGDLPEYHALSWADVPGYFHEIGLNRLTVGGFLQAVQAAGLVILDFGVVKDRHIGRLEEFLPRLEPFCEQVGITATDLSAEGFWIELAVPGKGGTDSFQSLFEARGFGRDYPLLISELVSSREKARELEGLLNRVENSLSFRLGRLLTAPLRGLRSLF